MSMDIQLTNLKGLLVNTAKFMQASQKSGWTHGRNKDTLEVWEETLDGTFETVYAMYLSPQERHDMRGITVILDDGTLGTITGFAINLQQIKEDSK